MVNDYSGWHWQHTNLEEPLEIKTIDRLHEIQTRSLVVVGDADLEPTREIADTLTNGLPHVAGHTIPGCGHMVTLEAPDACNRLLEGHLRLQSFRPDRNP